MPDITMRNLLLILPLILTACAVKLDPINDAEHLNRAKTDYELIYNENVPLDKPLTLEEAIVRGLKYNLDYRVTMLESTLQKNQLSVANFAMLPSIAASAGYNMRDKERAASSISLLSGTESLEPSYSEEKEHSSADLTFSWNLLDFGLSYFSAKQQADRVLVAVERRRQVMNKMTKEIVHSYWRAVKAQDLLPRVQSLLVQVDNALINSEKIEESNLANSKSTLEYRKNLLKLSMQLKKLNTELFMAKSELAGLINLSPSEKFTLDSSSSVESEFSKINISIKDLQDYGLIFRPELREEGYQSRIDQQNVKKEILRLFPGLSLVASTNYDDNDLLYYSSWDQLGIRTTWNLLSVLQGKKSIAAAESQVEVSKVRRLAQSAAILAQIAISYNQYEQSLESFDMANQISDLQMKMLDQVRKEQLTDNSTELDMVLRQAEAINALLERDNKFIETRASYHNLMTSIGLDIIPANIDFAKDNDLKKVIAESINANNLDIVTNRLKDIRNNITIEEEKNNGKQANDDVEIGYHNVMAVMALNEDNNDAEKISEVDNLKRIYMESLVANSNNLNN
jgi:multidrug efflux system outer membrane protein